MTVRLRNNLLTTGLVIAFLLFFSTFLFGYIILSINGNDARVEELNRIVDFHMIDDTILPSFITIQILVLLALIVSIGTIKSYKNTEAPELFFFTFFTLSISFESLRLLNAVIFVLDTPLYATQLVAKAIYFGRVFRLMSLLASTLYLTNFTYKRFGTILAASFLIAFSLAAYIPVDPTLLSSDLSYSLGIRNSRIFFSVAIYILVFLNLLIALFQKRYPRYLLLLTGVLIILSGSSLYLHDEHFILTHSGLFLVILGSIITTRSIEKIYIPL